MIEAHCLWLRRRGLAPATIHIRRAKLNAVEQRYGLATATTEQIEELLDTRRLGDKARYCWISHLSQFYRWGIDFGLLADDPTARLARPRMKQGKPRPIGTDDLLRAIQQAPPTMRCWLILMAFAGLRCQGVAGLRVEQIAWDDNMILVVEKGERERLVPMHPWVRTELRRTPMPTSGPVFRRPRGGPYPAAQVSRETSLFLSSLGIGATAHQLRHWFGTNVYRQSKDLRVTQELMGHASPTTTAGYADWSRTEARRAVEALSCDSQPSLLSEWSQTA